MADLTRPENWSLENEGLHRKIVKLDYFGKEHSGYERINRLPDYGKLWKQFSNDFRNQETKDITGRSGSYSPNLEQIEMIETKQDDI